MKRSYLNFLILPIGLYQSLTCLAADSPLCQVSVIYNPDYKYNQGVEVEIGKDGPGPKEKKRVENQHKLFIESWKAVEDHERFDLGDFSFLSLGTGPEIECGGDPAVVVYGINPDGLIVSAPSLRTTPLLNGNEKYKDKPGLENYTKFSGDLCDGSRPLSDIIDKLTSKLGQKPKFSVLFTVYTDLSWRENCAYLGKDLEKKLTALKTAPNVEVLGTKLMAVHATKYFPKEGCIQLTPSFASAQFRPKIHFSLGHLVESHEGGDWNQRPYAVVLPFKHLLPQLVNINAIDTTIFGDLELPLDAVIIAEQSSLSEKEQLQDIKQKIITFDKNKTTLRDEVEKVIKALGGWNIQNEKEVWHHQACFHNEIDINRPEFFKNVLDTQNYLCFGSELLSLVGENDLFGRLDFTLLSLLDEKIVNHNSIRTTSEKKMQLYMLNVYLKELEKFVKAMKPSKDYKEASYNYQQAHLEFMSLSKPGKKVSDQYKEANRRYRNAYNEYKEAYGRYREAYDKYKGHVDKVKHYMDLAELDIKLREKEGKTFMYDYLFFFSKNPTIKKDRKYVEEHSPELIPLMWDHSVKHERPVSTAFLEYRLAELKRLAEFENLPEYEREFKKRFEEEIAHAKPAEDYTVKLPQKNPPNTVTIASKLLIPIEGEFKVGNHVKIMRGILNPEALALVSEDVPLKILEVETTPDNHKH